MIKKIGFCASTDKRDLFPTLSERVDKINELIAVINRVEKDNLLRDKTTAIFYSLMEDKNIIEGNGKVEDMGLMELSVDTNKKAIRKLEIAKSKADFIKAKSNGYINGEPVRVEYKNEKGKHKNLVIIDEEEIDSEEGETITIHGQPTCFEIIANWYKNLKKKLNYENEKGKVPSVQG